MTDLAVGDVVRVYGGTKWRPGVVVRVFLVHDRLRALVLFGTGTSRPDLRHVEVQPATAAGRAIGLEKPTYFYDCNSTLCWADKVERRGVRCPPAVLNELRALIGL
jgi:hypothetical protein